MSLEILFNLQLWHVDRYWGFIKKWDNKLLSADRTYYIQTPGQFTQFTIYDTNYNFKVKVKTIGVEKANTIAIYETNGTVFNGHYQQQEKMNIIQLYINDSGDGTPFVEGPNVIVIPTRLFTETIFNAHVQNETLDETPIYSANEEIFKFISVGREGNTEQACDEVDFVFIRFDISSEDAMEILNLLLTCLVNETTNETAITYSYVSTKENGTSAAKMNLHISVLGYIPWFCNFTDSPQGSKPKDFEDWFWSSLKALGEAIFGFVMTIVMVIIEIVKLIINLVAKIFMEMLPILAYILWLIIRVVILILTWICFVVTLLILTLVLALIAVIVLPFTLLFGSGIQYTVNTVGASFSNFTFKMGYTIHLEFQEFFKISIPFLVFYFYLGDTQIFNVTIKFWPPNFIINSGNSIYTDDIPKSSDNVSIDEIYEFKADNEYPKVRSSSTELSFFNSEVIMQSFNAFFIGLDHSFGMWSAWIVMETLSLAFPENLKYIKLAIQVLSLCVVAGIILFHFMSAKYNKYEYLWYGIAFGIVSILTGIIFYKIGKPKEVWDEESFFDSEFTTGINNLTSFKEFLKDAALKDLFP
ncbi:MAG: hypothetical protein ACFFG0_40740, partial [Candidatus Thorarchaeota archaeon]